MTALIQPMDQGVMANFKAYYLCMTFGQALAAMNRDTDMMLRDFLEVIQYLSRHSEHCKSMARGYTKFFLI
jgi:hypothetical protein